MQVGSLWLTCAILAGQLVCCLPSQAAFFFGPSPYTSAAGIPASFYAGGPTALEDFEDSTLSFGITASAGAVIPPGFEGFIDSVDADDGTIDGSGSAGHSWFSIAGSTGITFTFSGPLPTAAGLVWTDGAGTVTFEAFGPGMVSLGTIGPFSHPDGSFSGTTAEDRFYGVHDLGGILAIKISNTSGGLEVDHVQFGRAPIPDGTVPEPASLLLWGVGAIGCAVGGYRRRRAS